MEERYVNKSISMLLPSAYAIYLKNWRSSKKENCLLLTDSVTD